METPESKTLIVGVGNEYRGDDGVGPFIARKLKRKDLPGTLVVISTGEGTSLMELWSGASVVILIDAMHSGDPPGNIRCFDCDMQSIPGAFFPNSSHHFGVVEAVALAKVLNRLPPHLMVYGIEGKSFKEGIGLSPEVMKAAELVERKVVHDILQPGVVENLRYNSKKDRWNDFK